MLIDRVRMRYPCGFMGLRRPAMMRDFIALFDIIESSCKCESAIRSEDRLKIFVSSTVFDLIDVRAEVKSLLEELGITPIMSDESLSGFNVDLDRNSIEVCLVNVDAADAVIVVLNQRYGPMLGNCGFPDISATHLEYRRAKDKGKKILFYVRNRLEADFRTYRQNTGSDVKLSWVKTENDKKLFGLIDEHSALSSTGPNNWYSTFISSVDLKQSLKKALAPAITPEILANAICRNQFPLFVPLLVLESHSYFLELTNTSKSPAFNFVASVASSKASLLARNGGMPKWDIVLPGQKIELLCIFEHEPVTRQSRMTTQVRTSEEILKTDLKLEFESAIGVLSKEKYDWTSSKAGDWVPVQNLAFTGRTFHIGNKPHFVIDGP